MVSVVGHDPFTYRLTAPIFAPKQAKAKNFFLKSTDPSPPCVKGTHGAAPSKGPLV